MSANNNIADIVAQPLAPAGGEMKGTESLVVRPSDLTYLWQECHRCFYNAIKLGFRRPPTALPAIFQAIDEQMKSYFLHARTEAAGEAVGVPPGKFSMRDIWVTSKPLHVPGNPIMTVVIKGCIDTAITLDNGTLCLCDFKTTKPSANASALYARQLNAYAVALKFAAKTSISVDGDVTRIGLLTFSPNRFALRPHNSFQLVQGKADGPQRPASLPSTDTTRAFLGGSLTWNELPLDERAFGGFIATMLSIVTAPEPPPPNPQCRYCQYLGDYEHIATRRQTGGTR